jgi:hypothetical protein
MIWLAHFVSASAWKKSFGKPCWYKSMRTAGIGSVRLLRDAEEATRNVAAAYAITPKVGSLIGNPIIYRDSSGRQVLINAVTGEVGTGTNMSGYPTYRALGAEEQHETIPFSFAADRDTTGPAAYRVRNTGFGKRDKREKTEKRKSLPSTSHSAHRFRRCHIGGSVRPETFI